MVTLNSFKWNQAGTRLKGKLSSHRYLQPQGKAQVTGYSLGEATAEADGWRSDIESDLHIRASDESESD